MKAQKVRDLDENEIKQQLKEMDEQMFRLQFSDVHGPDGRAQEGPPDEEGSGADLHHPAGAGVGGGEEVDGRNRSQNRVTEGKGSLKNEKVGKVVSTKMQKTIVVEVSRRVPHPLYKRIIGKRKKFYAHDEESTARLGDEVRIVECRPLSKLKRWRLLDVVRRAPQVAVAPKDLDVKVREPDACGRP